MSMYDCAICGAERCEHVIEDAEKMQGKIEGLEKQNAQLLKEAKKVAKIAIEWAREYKSQIEAEYDMDDHPDEVPTPYWWADGDIGEVGELLKKYF